VRSLPGKNSGLHEALAAGPKEGGSSESEDIEMKVRVVPSPKLSAKREKEFTVELQQGAQYFRLDYTGAKSECQWYAKMFRVALKKSVAEESRPVARKPRSKRSDIETAIPTIIGKASA
jgi:hypothetical protein